MCLLTSKFGSVWRFCILIEMHPITNLYLSLSRNCKNRLVGDASDNLDWLKTIFFFLLSNIHMCIFTCPGFVVTIWFLFYFFPLFLHISFFTSFLLFLSIQASVSLLLILFQSTRYIPLDYNRFMNC